MTDQVIETTMACVVVPTRFETNLALGNGSTGFSLSQAFSLKEKEIPNLYSVGVNKFDFDFQDHGVAYNETEASVLRAQASFEVQGCASGLSLTVDPTSVVMWGVNFAGKVLVKHGGCERLVYLPGTRTYDPAGMTGDPHASERIGPSCSRTQVAITLAQLVAAQNGANCSQLNLIQDKVLPLVRRYHGRETLLKWMTLQIVEVVFKNQDVTPYPEFIKEQVRMNNLELNNARDHTKAFLESYNSGHPHPPVHYYQKVAKKDNVAELFSAEDLAKFNSIIA